MPNKRFSHKPRPIPQGVPTRPPSHCRSCRYTGVNYCRKHRAGWPEVGTYCYGYEAKP